MLAGLLLAAAAACPCRKPQDIVIAFDASKKDAPSIDGNLTAALTALVQELSGPDSATQIALVAFAGKEGECDPITKCTTDLTDLTSDASELTDAIAGRNPSADDRCTSCGIERAFQLLSDSQRKTADATMLLLINGVQNVGGSYDTAANKSAELLVFLHRSTPPLNLALTLAGCPDRRIRPWPAGIRAFRPWGSWTAM